jgi:predicted AAA+ superfamily ATPase
LLEEVFRLACRYIGQSLRQGLYMDEIKRAMHANIGWQRILAYLKFLDATLLVRLIEPLELRLKRARGPSKLCLCDHALRAAWLQEVIPLDEPELDRNPHLRDLAGHIAESTVGYFFKSLTDLDVALTYPPKLVPLTMLGFPCKRLWNCRRNHEEETVQ